MKTLFTAIFVFSSLFLFSQEKKELILEELKNLSADSGMVLKNKNDSTETIVYKLCNNWADKVNSLKKELNTSDVDKLLEDENTAINIIGYIFILEENNNKEYALAVLEKMIETEMKFMKSGCSDAVTLYSDFRYLLRLMTTENSYFKANFKFKRKELKEIDKKMITAETIHWYRSQ